MSLLSNQGRINLLQILYLLSVFFLPTQFGKHFWPSQSFILGIRVDYLSPTLYLTDILMLSLLSVFVLQYGKHLWKKVKTVKIGLWHVAFLFLVLSFLYAIIESLRPQLVWYGAFKALEMIGFSLVTAFLLKDKLMLRKTIYVLLAAMCFQSMLAIAQFLNQASIGTAFYFFGERSFNSLTPGIATGVFGNELVLRPYGTLPHPNVLAGYLVVSMLITFCTSKILGFKNTAVLFIVWGLSSVAVVLSLSRVNIVLALLFWLIYFWQTLRPKYRGVVIFVSVLVILVGSIFLSQRFFGLTIDSESFSQRQELLLASIEIFNTSTVFGVGQNHFLVHLPDYLASSGSIFLLQPVHAIYFLALSEWGILGLSSVIIVIYLLFQRIRNSKNKIKLNIQFLFLIVLIIGFVDHYLFTLQQGQMLLAFSLGFIYAMTKPVFAPRNVKKSSKASTRGNRKKTKI